MAADSNQFETRRQLLRMQMLYEVGLALGESLDFPHVAKEILQRAVAMVDARRGMLALRAPSSSDLEIVCEAGLGHAAAALLQLPQAEAAWRRQVITQVSRQDDSARHVCCVPLRFQGDTLGLLIVVDRESRSGGTSAFPESDCDLLDSFALQAGAALHNAQLHRQLRSAYEELRAAQEKVARLERLRALGDLAAEITHAMRHVLGLVIGHADSFLSLQMDPVAAMQALLRAAEGGQALIDRIDRVTRLGVGRERASENLNRLLRQAAEEASLLARDDLGSAATVEWEMRLGAVPPTYLNPADVREVFVNLLLNALQAMPEGGRLTVTTRAEEDRLLATVADTGCGMSDDVRRRVFEPFYSTRDGAGSGLGLSIVYRIVDDHGGTVSLSSTPGGGTEVTVALPILSSPPPPVEDGDAPEDPGD